MANSNVDNSNQTCIIEHGEKSITHITHVYDIVDCFLIYFSFPFFISIEEENDACIFSIAFAQLTSFFGRLVSHEEKEEKHNAASISGIQTSLLLL